MKMLFQLIVGAIILAGSMRPRNWPGTTGLTAPQRLLPRLLLQPDGKFKYMLVYGAADYSADGTWRVDGDSVVLNTAGASAPTFRLVASSTTKTAGRRVIVKAPNRAPAQNIDVVLHTGAGEVEGRTDEQGVAAFEDVRSAKSVRLIVRVYSLDAGPYEVKSTDNDFLFEINGEAITRAQFKDERLRVTGATLEMLFWDKDQPMKYQKSR